MQQASSSRFQICNNYRHLHIIFALFDAVVVRGILDASQDRVCVCVCVCVRVCVCVCAVVASSSSITANSTIHRRIAIRSRAIYERWSLHAASLQLSCMPHRCSRRSLRFQRNPFMPSPSANLRHQPTSAASRGMLPHPLRSPAAITVSEPLRHREVCFVSRHPLPSPPANAVRQPLQHRDAVCFLGRVPHRRDRRPLRF